VSLSLKNVSGALAVKRKYYRSSSSSFNGFSSVCIFFEFDFKPFSDAYKSETLSRGIKSVFRLLIIPLVEHIKIVATANPFNKENDEYFTKRYSALKLRNNFSY
jgi:hypothetical protein